MIITGDTRVEKSMFDKRNKKCRHLHSAIRNVDALNIIKKLLKRLKKAVKTCDSEELWRQRAQNDQLDVIILDMQVVDIDPIKLCQ